jgi:hypothetical protein
MMVVIAPPAPASIKVQLVQVELALQGDTTLTLDKDVVGGRCRGSESLGERGKNGI